MSKFIDYCLNVSAENRMEEFKRLGEEKSKIVRKTLESIVAMTNTDGGFIIFGIDDPEKGEKIPDKRVFGIEENLEEQANLIFISSVRLDFNKYWQIYCRKYNKITNGKNDEFVQPIRKMFFKL